MKASNKKPNNIYPNISAGPTASEASALTRFKTRAANGSNKPISPFLRAKQSNNSSDAGSNPAEGNKNTNNIAANAAANHNDVAAKLSFKEEQETNADSKDAEPNVINGSIEDDNQKKVSFTFYYVLFFLTASNALVVLEITLSARKLFAKFQPPGLRVMDF